MTLLLAGLVFLVFFAAAWRVASWFFRGAHSVQDEEPITGYADPANYQGRMRW